MFKNIQINIKLIVTVIGFLVVVWISISLNL